MAIVETMGAMAASLAVGVHFDTWLHVALGAGIAPLLLLRTEASCVRAAQWLKRLVRELESSPFFLPGMAAGFPVVRIAATGWTLLRTPTTCVRSIPTNWWRIALSTDFAVSPEILPAPAARAGGFFRVYELIQIITKAMTRGAPAVRLLLSAVRALLWTPVFGLMVLPPFLYRWSIKSTALVWAPLLWALKPVKPPDREWLPHVKVESDLKKPQVVALISSIVIALLGCKYVLWAGHFSLATTAGAWRELATRRGWELADSVLWEAIIAVVRPGAIPLWQVASFANAVLGLFVWWRIREWLAMSRNNVPVTDVAIERTLSRTFFFRRLLSSYIIVCNGYIAWQLARKLPVPKIGSELFPWV